MDHQYIFIGIVALIIVNLWIVFELIKSANNSKRKISLEEAKLKLLVKIASKLGVTQEEIENSVDNDQSILKTRHDTVKK